MKKRTVKLLAVIIPLIVITSFILYFLTRSIWFVALPIIIFHMLFYLGSAYIGYKLAFWLIKKMYGIK